MLGVDWLISTSRSWASTVHYLGNAHELNPVRARWSESTWRSQRVGRLHNRHPEVKVVDDQAFRPAVQFRRFADVNFAIVIQVAVLNSVDGESSIGGAQGHGRVRRENTVRRRGEDRWVA